MLNKIYESDNLSAMLVNLKGNYSFKAIVIRITGTNGVTPATLDDVGRIVYQKKGFTIIDMAFEYFSAINDLISGIPDVTSPASGALDFFISIPRRWGDSNVEHISSNDNASLSINFGTNLETRIGSGGKVEVYLDVEDGIQKYDLMFKQYGFSQGGAGTPHIAIEQDNIVSIFMTEYLSSELTLASGLVTAIQGNLGHKNINASIGAIIDDTSYKYRIEQTPDDIKAVNLFNAEGDITSGLIDGVAFNTTVSGATIIELAMVSMFFDPDKLTKSVLAQQTRVNTIVNSKIARGKTNDVATLRKISARVG